MNKTKLFLIIILVFQSVIIEVYADITSDLNNGETVVQAAKNAHQDNVSADVAVREFVNQDIDVIKAVQTVAKEWSNCEDTYLAVQTGIQDSPDKAPQIVSSIATMNNCACSAKSFWGRARVEQRLRKEVHRALVRIGNSCSCSAAGIEAAIEMVPEQTEDLIDAVLKAKNSSNHVVDSIGKVGALPEMNSWKNVLNNTASLSRLQTVCKGDNNDSDAFDINQQWSAGSQGNDQLGSHRLNCDDEDEGEKFDEKSNDLIISQYIENSGQDQALELFNGTNRIIDLALGNYQVEVYFHGYNHPGEIVQLNGVVKPGQTFVVANSQANTNIQNRTNQKVAGLVFNGADAIVLKNGFMSGSCECSVTTVAAAFKGVSDDNQNEQNKQEQDFLDRLKLRYGSSSIQTSIVDSIGRIWENRDGDEINDRVIVADQTLRRKNQVCQGDRLELDPFHLRDEWQRYETDSTGNAGTHQMVSCDTTATDLILSEYIEGTEKNQLVEIFNGTNRPIDFNTEKHLLEIYQDDDENPEHVIELSGMVNSNKTFIITHEDAEDEFLNLAHMKTGKLNLSNARAVVLKKVITPAFKSCYADISNWLKNPTTDFILDPVFDPDSGPDSGDDPRDGDDGGDLASPN
ncbi:MAG: lamin tail domain-containing protein [Proteobacteria bacterium]|nr:lamin tail domain-containing protein [Pseudomonadota bacterium]